MVNVVEVCEMRSNHPTFSLQRIGDAFDITREGVRQILFKVGLPTCRVWQRYLCRNCEKVIKGKNTKFCNRQCQYSFCRIPIPCEVCGRIKLYLKSRVKSLQAKGMQQHFFCGRRCIAIHMGRLNKKN